MKRKTFSPEQIIGKLSDAKFLLSQGHPVGAVSLRLKVAEQAYHRWSRGKRPKDI